MTRLDNKRPKYTACAKYTTVLAPNTTVFAQTVFAPYDCNFLNMTVYAKKNTVLSQYFTDTTVIAHETTVLSPNKTVFSLYNTVLAPKTTAFAQIKKIENLQNSPVYFFNMHLILPQIQLCFPKIRLYFPKLNCSCHKYDYFCNKYDCIYPQIQPYFLRMQ